MSQHEAIAAVVVLAMKNAIAPLVTEVAALRSQVQALEARELIPGPPGPPGPRGDSGLDGRHGADGFSLEDFSAEFDGDRTLTLRYARGTLEKTFPLVLPFPRYRGVFTLGAEYTVGDVVTHGGSSWYCQKDTQLPPRDDLTEWRLMVKRGRDGRDRDRGPRP